MNHKQKPKLLVFIDYFLPGYKAGGPIKSVNNIITSLSPNFDFDIITSDRDLGDKLPYQNIEFNSWISKDKYSIIYLNKKDVTKWLKKHFKENYYHACYFNSLYAKEFTLKPLLFFNKLNTPPKLILAPRGMLGKGAINAKPSFLPIKPIKKKSFLLLSHVTGFFKHVIWHTTNKLEKQDVIDYFGSKSNIKIASNISINKVNRKEIVKIKDELKLVFFSRISPKKNLLYTLELLKNIPNVSLTIYGSIEEDIYWNRCIDFIQANNINADYKGEVIPADVNSILSNYHFFILPTMHENYGHVITEALTAGCGLIISDKTPWRNLSSKKIGWDLDLKNQEKIIETIKYCLAIDQDEYNIIRNNCYNFVEQEINSTKEIEDTIKLFIDNES